MKSKTHCEQMELLSLSKDPSVGECNDKLFAYLHGHEESVANGLEWVDWSVGSSMEHKTHHDWPK